MQNHIQSCFIVFNENPSLYQRLNAIDNKKKPAISIAGFWSIVKNSELLYSKRNSSLMSRYTLTLTLSPKGERELVSLTFVGLQ
jgi:hypothetical protein